MKKIINLIVLSFVFANYLYSQNIKGKVVDIDNQPVEYATIIVQSPDSSFLDAIRTDSLGFFSSNIASPEKFLLNIQHLAYSTKLLEFTNKADVGIIVLQAKNSTLNEVVVKAQKPLVKVENSKLTYDLQQINNGKVVSNAYDLVLQIPGVQESDGNLTLSGASKLNVILNGKPTTLTDAQLISILKTLPASRLTSAEVMYSTPPEYHVRGASINLIIDKGSNDSKIFQGEVNLGYTQKIYSNYFASLSLLYNSPKYSLNFQYSPVKSKAANDYTLYSLHTFNDSIYKINQTSNGIYQSLTHNLYFDWNYKIDLHNNLDITYYGQISPNDVMHQSTSDNMTPLTENNKTGHNYLHNIGVDYSSDTLGLKTGVNFTRYKTVGIQNFDNKESGSDALNFSAATTQQIDKFKIYLDKNHLLKNNWTLKYGTEFNYAKDYNSQIYSESLSGNNTEKAYNEYTFNVYAGFDKSFTEKLSCSFALTEEFFQMADYKKWTLYPDFSVTYVQSPTHIFQLNFSSDKVYPNYWEIQNSISYLNNYTLIYGNPNLKPYENYTTQLSYILKSSYIFTLYNTYMPNYFAQMPYQSSESLNLIYQTLNWNYSEISGLNVIMPIHFGEKLKTKLTLNGFHKNEKFRDYHGINFNRGKWSLYSTIDNTFTITEKPNIKLQLTAFYLTPSTQGIYDLSKVWSVNMAAKWVSANNKFEINLSGNDLFNSSTPNTKVFYETQNLTMNLNQDKRYVKLSFIYRFGGYKEQAKKEVDTSRFGTGTN